jgi:hypothetical protein
MSGRRFSGACVVLWVLVALCPTASASAATDTSSAGNNRGSEQTASAATVVAERAPSDAQFNYTVLPDGSLVVANRGHIDLANGSDVLAAGEVRIVNSQIRSINNASGHYRPSGSSTQSAAEDAFNALDLDVAPGEYREIGG